MPRAVSRVTARQVKYVHPVVDPQPGSLVEAVYRQAAAEMRIVTPPLQLHSPDPRTLAAFWLMLRETLNADGVVSRGDKEVVAAAVSVANVCPYCVDMHTAAMYDVATADDAESVGADRIDEVRDDQRRALAWWARQAHLLDEPVAAPAGLSAAEVAELVGVAVTFHYLNRMVNVFLSDYLLPPRVRGRARQRMKHGVSLVLRPMLRRPPPAGESLGLLPAAPLPADVSWAAGSAPVAGAFARAGAAFEAAGAAALPAAVRDLIVARLGAWRGEEMGISRAWCERTLEALRPEDRAAGRLALLTAFASYQIDEHVVREYRQEQPGDAAIVQAAGWVSYTVARRIGERLAARIATPVAPHRDDD